MKVQSILGVNGTIATALLPILLANKENVRLVSRNPKPVEGEYWLAALKAKSET